VLSVFGDGDSYGLSQERVLARARLILAGASLAAFYVDPTRPVRYVTAAFALLVAYVIASLLYLVVVSQMQSLPARCPSSRISSTAASLAFSTLSPAPRAARSFRSSPSSFWPRLYAGVSRDAGDDARAGVGDSGRDLVLLCPWAACRPGPISS
jgi:hypothetical protein